MLTCPNCGEQNPERFRLCGFCGTPLVAELPAQETRKTVTIVFSDLEGSTALGERLDSEALREVMARYFDEMRGALELHGGTIEKYIGDAIMAVFGLPTTHEDDALRAVRAAAEMKRRLALLNSELEARWGVSLRNRTGVNTGEVVAGDPTTGQRLVTGDTVNTAARLEQAAPALEVLLGEPTYRLVRNAVEVEAVEPLSLKGKAETVPAYRLVSVQEVGQQERARPRVFVGRERELDRLGAAYAGAVAEGTPRTVTILAEAGVGKSRLTEEFLDAIGDEPLVLTGRCLPYGRGITFWALGEIVRQAAGIGEDDPPEVALARLRELGSSDDGVAERLAAAVGLLESSFPVDETFLAARRFLELLAQRRPVVVVWEDLHWAEATLLDLIDRLARTAGGPIVLICTGRPTFVEVWQRGLPGDVINLQPLSSDAIERFVDALLGDAAIDPVVRERIIVSAEGNPLYAEQTFSMLIDEGVVRPTPDGWIVDKEIEALAVPPTIQALLTARLDSLPAADRALVDVASVIGLEFARDAVEALVPDAVRTELELRLDSLTEKRLVRRARSHDAAARMFRFDHILIRDAAYGGLLKRRRAELHEAFADWGDRVNSERGRGVEYQEILGFHLEQAHTYLAELQEPDDHQRGLAKRAAEKLLAAGRRAVLRGDMPAAANLLRRAHALLPEDDVARIELVPDLAQALTETGEFAWAEVFLSDAIETAGRLGQSALAAEARLAQLVTQRFGGSDETNWCDAVLKELDTAVPLFEEEHDHRRLGKAWRLAMDAYGISYRFGDAAAAAERAVRHARLGSDDRGVAAAASTYAMAALYGPTPVSEALVRCEETLNATAGNRKLQAFVTLLMSPLHAMSGEFETARRLYGEARASFDELGATLLGARTSLQSAVVELLAGDLEAAERELRRDYETLDSLGERYLRPTVAANLALIRCRQKDFDDAARFANIAEEVAADDDVESQALWRSAKALILARGGDAAAAETTARAAVELLRRTDALVQIADALIVQASVLQDQGRADERATALHEAMSLYERKENLVSERAARSALG
ncbi:MAG: adenylate/guanylate cyclase domain-containing protein [Actinobacteria bacterium]|nr:MAG: adenylate/guanylate cyclase domain-containing protein [Actinomycetota bacterium]